MDAKGEINHMTMRRKNRREGEITANDHEKEE
jgi:hypothetical protein